MQHFSQIVQRVCTSVLFINKCTGINTLHTMLGYMGIYKTLKTIETLALHERVTKLASGERVLVL